MRDLQFEFGAVPQRYQDVVQRMAVLYRIRGIGYSPNQIREKVAELQQQWRARVGALSNVGWRSRGDKPVSWSSLRNCLPTFAFSMPYARTCDFVTICPFCYARWVRKIWLLIDQHIDQQTVETATTDEGQMTRQLLLPRMLNAEGVDADRFDGDTEDVDTDIPTDDSRSSRHHWIERRHTYQRATFVEESSQAVVENLAALLRGIAAIRSQIVSQISPVGALVYTTIVPSADNTLWVVTNRQLFKVHSTTQVPSEWVAKTVGVLTRHVNPTRATLVRAVARTCEYPVPLLTGDAAITALMLNVRQQLKFRSFAVFRAFVTRSTYE